MKARLKSRPPQGLSALPEATRAQIRAWLAEPGATYASVKERVAAELGVQTSGSALADFLRKQQSFHAPAPAGPVEGQAAASYRGSAQTGYEVAFTIPGFAEVKLTLLPIPQDHTP